MKASKFNTFVDNGNGEILAYNSMTGALAKIDYNTYETYKRIISDHGNEMLDESDPRISEIIANFKKGGYLVDDSLDEIGILKVKKRNEKI